MRCHTLLHYNYSRVMFGCIWLCCRCYTLLYVVIRMRGLCGYTLPTIGILLYLTIVHCICIVYLCCYWFLALVNYLSICILFWIIFDYTSLLIKSPKGVLNKVSAYEFILSSYFLAIKGLNTYTLLYVPL